MTDALVKLLDELVEGPGEVGWVLNPRDRGLLKSLDELSADRASAIPEQGGASIAAHVDHLRYGLELLNRWSRGGEPFAGADYTASWERNTVSASEWAERREALKHELRAWREAIQTPRDLTTVASSIVHLAYHLGAIRQIDRSMRGPSAAMSQG